MENLKNVRAIVPSDYEILKNSGEQTKDLEYGTHKLLRYLPKNIFSEESIRNSLKKYSLENMLAEIRKYFEREYHFFDEKIELNNRYQRSINSYIWVGDKENELHFIHIDELYEAALLYFLLTTLKWAKEFDNLETYRFGFIHMLYTLNDVSILGNLPDEKSADVLLSTLDGDLQIINLAEDCYWTITAFVLAHEIAHAYLIKKMAKPNAKPTRKQLQQEEYDADAIAYDIVLKIIIDSRQQSRENRMLEEYTYLAPIIFMDYIELMYYTDKVLYDALVSTYNHPLLQNRKSKLFSIPYDEKYEFDTVEGNAVYNGFLNAYDEYRTQLLLKKERGKLTRIINQERLIKVEEFKHEQERRRITESENSGLSD